MNTALVCPVNTAASVVMRVLVSSSLQLSPHRPISSSSCQGFISAATVARVAKRSFVDRFNAVDFRTTNVPTTVTIVGSFLNCERACRRFRTVSGERGDPQSLSTLSVSQVHEDRHETEMVRLTLSRTNERHRRRVFSGFCPIRNAKRSTARDVSVSERHERRWKIRTFTNT